MGHVTTYTVSNLASGDTYYFAVTAYDIFANESDYSVEIRATIPRTPPPTPESAPKPNTLRTESRSLLIRVGEPPSPVVEEPALADDDPALAA